MVKLVCAVVALLLVLEGRVQPQALRESPCPDVFVYEPTTDQENRWYGVISIRTREELHGVWIHVFLDNKAELLGNWFGEATSKNNMEFTIKNPQYSVKPGPPLRVRFFIKYDPQGPVPLLKMITTNGRKICGEEQAPVPVDFNTLHLSRPTPEIGNQNQGSRPVTGESSSIGNNFVVGSAGQSAINRRPDFTANSNNEEEFFPGDFNQSRRPIVTSLLENLNENTCGVAYQQPRPLITYGKETTAGQWPWHAALYRSKGTDLQYICGGSLITRRHVLTAAHCVTKLHTNRAISPELLQVYLGKFSLRKLNPGVQSMIVNRVLVHPDYNATVFHNDIAILKLNQKAEITDYVRPVCLWEEQDTSVNSVVEKLGTVVGWGYDETGTLTENLMQAKMPVVTTETCIFSNRDFFSRFTSSKTFCAGFRNGTSACTGDSGGGMFFPKSGGDGKIKIWQIRGVVSLSAALQNEQVICDTSNYIVFTDAAKYLGWIKETIERR